MLNLSDKDLDRFSREAAQEHDPGDVLGPRSWDKLEIRLDRDLGRASPNPARGIRGIRRLPFYYAPAALLLLGVSFYFIRQNNKMQEKASSGSPPLTVIKNAPAAPGTPGSLSSSSQNSSSSTQKPEPADKSTSTKSASTPALPSTTAEYPTTPHPEADRRGETDRQQLADRRQLSDRRAEQGLAAHGSTTDHAASGATADAAASGSAGDRLAGRTHTGRSPVANTAGSRTLSPASTHNAAHHKTADRNATAGRTHSGRSRNPTSPDYNHTGISDTHNGINRNHNGISRTHPDRTHPPSGSPSTTRPESMIAGAPTPSGSAGSAQPNSASHEMALSPVRGPHNFKQVVSIDDSALRALTVKTSPVQPARKKGGLHINRSLQLGLLVAPDFSSVNSVAGDKPGSSFGLTVDYQFASRWYLGTGLLISRKNYAAVPQDFHAPANYFQQNNLSNVDFVKGSFQMLEIPLNLRYDFSVTGNTLFFATAGVSSYLRTREDCNYYLNFWGRDIPKGFRYSNQPDNLFSSVNLSVGVETGISNGLSLLIAPYMKIPVRNIGFGQVEMSSVGINFALKFAPVLSRKR